MSMREGGVGDISIINVKQETCSDSGSVLMFQDSHGEFHEVLGLPGNLDDVGKEGWRLVAAVEMKVEGREQTLYQAATRTQIGSSLFWDE